MIVRMCALLACTTYMYCTVGIFVGANFHISDQKALRINFCKFQFCMTELPEHARALHLHVHVLYATCSAA